MHAASSDVIKFILHKSKGLVQLGEVLCSLFLNGIYNKVGERRDAI